MAHGSYVIGMRSYAFMIQWAMALMPISQANELVSQALESRLNEAIRQAASQGKKQFTFDFGPWSGGDQNKAKKALIELGYRVEKAKAQYASPDACEISW